MDIEFADDNLDRLETDPTFTGGLIQTLVKAVRKKFQIIRAAPDEREFYKLKSLRFEKLKGKRKHQHSMRLNDQYRLIVELQEQNPESRTKKIRVIGIEDYH